MQIDRTRVRQVFADYTAHYNAQDPKIKLKIDHTYRVAALSQRIAESLRLPPPEVELAWLIGMLHDLGRFEQVRRFGTFNDGASVDHAKLGAEILFDQGMIRQFCPDADEDGLIRIAIEAHNLYRIPAGLDERTLLFCRLIRDADKVDIFKVNCLTPLEEIHNVTTQELRSSTITPAVLEAFLEGHTVLRSLRKNAVDHVVSMISLAFELEFPASRRIAKEQGYLDQLLAFSSDDTQTQRDLVLIRQKMAEYLQQNS